MSPRSLTQSLSATVFGNGIADLDEPARRRVRAAQIGAVLQLVPLTMAVNLLNAGLVVYLFWDSGSSNRFLIVWGTLIAGFAVASFWSWQRRRRRPLKGASARAVRHLILHAAFLGGAWGAAAYVLFPTADTMH